MADETNSIPAATSEAANESTENLETTENTEETEASAEEGEESQEAKKASDGEAAKATKEQKKEEKKANKKKFKIKVDQKEEDFEIDLDNEEDLKKHVQLSRVAQKRMAEMSDLKKDVTDLITRLNADPFSVLSDKESGLGLNIDDLVRQYVEKKLADAEKTPEQLEKERLAAELKSIKDEREKEKADRKREQESAALQSEVVRYDNLMTKALENSEFKKPSPYLINKMTDYMVLGVQNKIDLTPEDILPLIREDVKNEIRELINSAPEEVIEEMFGNQIFDRMRKKHVTKAKQAPVHASSVKDIGSKGKSNEPAKEKVPMKKFFGF